MTDDRIKRIREWLANSPWAGLAAHVAGPFIEPKAPPGLLEMYDLAQELERLALELSVRFAQYAPKEKRWRLESIPTLQKIDELLRVVRGTRQLMEQHAFGGDPWYTGEPDPEQRLQKQREAYERRKRKENGSNGSH